uniref:DUF908 domain-containing protein n=1 Tax=Romanomermis culicivorax TaxID=13658 RepID=A0A915HS18_ROMCU
MVENHARDIYAHFLNRYVMKIDQKVRKPTSELGEKAKKFVTEVCSLKGLEFTDKLVSITNWEFGKLFQETIQDRTFIHDVLMFKSYSELCLWADVLNIIDDILESATKKNDESHVLACDVAENHDLRQQVLDSLKFTATLFEYSFTRGVYQSIEHLTTLLESSDITIIVAVLNVLYVSSKRTSYLGSLPTSQKDALLVRLICLAENYGGKDNGFTVAQCCLKESSSTSFQVSKPPTSLHFEFFDDVAEESDHSSSPGHIHFVHIESVDHIPQCTGKIMDDIMKLYRIPPSKRIQLLTQIRWAKFFDDYPKRLLCINARLLSLSVLIYSNMLQDNNNNVLYNGFIEECVEALRLQDTQPILEIKTEILKTLTAIIYLDRNPKLNTIIEATGASAYHGYLPTLVRTCVDNFIG